MITKAEFLEKILNINPKYNTELIGKAFDTAQRLHEGQLRKSGEPYFIHPINVALILAEMGMDDATIVGGLLHDVVEDTPYTREQLVADFGEEIALLVDGVTKLGTIKFESKEEIQAENFRKMFLAMSKDIRVLIIKLADRLHNMRTMEYMSPEKKLSKFTRRLPAGSVFPKSSLSLRIWHSNICIRRSSRTSKKRSISVRKSAKRPSIWSSARFETR